MILCLLHGRAARRVILRPARTVAAFDIVLDDGFEFLRDAVALQGNGTFTIDIHRRRGNLAGAGQTDADIGVPAFTRTVDHAAHDSDAHGFNAWITGLPDRGSASGREREWPVV